ncbi:hypothetical protein [Paraburkholderia sp.]|uniref:hypothetical protein n=1 Tax=Paraburkholderia sp. TaxID=1926495 RepID=UPI003D6DD91F
MELKTLRDWLFDMLRVRAERYAPTRRDAAAHPLHGTRRATTHSRHARDGQRPLR